MKKHLQKFGPLYGGILGVIGVIGILAAYGLAVAHSTFAPVAYIGAVGAFCASMALGLSDWE